MFREINTKLVDVVFETGEAFSEWFGYYNLDVFNHDRTCILCNRSRFDARTIAKDDTIDLGWYDIQKGEWHYIDTTDSFNWEQGANLQWLRGKGNETKVIYNKSDKEHFYSVIYDIASGSKRTVHFPVYATSPDGKYAVSLNYERSYWCRAYHYMPVANEKYNVRFPEDDGIFLVDLEKDNVERLISIQDIVNIDPIGDFGEAWHWLEHIMLNRSGTRIAFLHRFSYSGVNRYQTRAIVANIDGTGLQVLKDWKKTDVTHLGWGESEFVIYGEAKGAIEAAYGHSSKKQTSKFSLITWLKKIVKHVLSRKMKDGLKKADRGYRLYREKDGVFQHAQTYKCELFEIDGHPSMTVDGRFIVTDTYPDKNDNQSLVIYDRKTGKNVVLATLKAGLKGNPASCDLHPKLCCGDQVVVVDTAYTGRHQMIVMKIKWDQVEKRLAQVE